MDIHDGAELLAAAVGAISTVIDQVRNAAPKDPVADRAKDALTVIGAIVDTVKAGDLDNLDPKTARAELDRVIAALKQTDAEADAALDKKFADPDTSGG